MPKKHPRLAFWLTVIPAALASLLAIYHLLTVAVTLADKNYIPMLGGFTGAIYQMFDYFAICLPVCLLLLAALLMNIFWSHALSKAWGVSAITAIAVFLVCGLFMIFGIHSGQLTVSLHLAARAIAQSITAVTLTHSLTRKVVSGQKSGQWSVDSGQKDA